MGNPADSGRLPFPAMLPALVSILLGGCAGGPMVGETGLGQSPARTGMVQTVSEARYVQPPFEVRAVKPPPETQTKQMPAETTVMRSSLGMERTGPSWESRPAQYPSETKLIQSPLMPDVTPADRVVALQTQTMLAGLACGAVWGDYAAFTRYADFTVRNAALLRRSQRDVAVRLGGLEEFDSMHTRISNGESQRLLSMGDAAYCAEMRGPFYTVVALDETGLASKSMAEETVVALLR